MPAFRWAALALFFSGSALAQPIVYLDEDFDDNTAGWILPLGGEWQIGPASSSPPSPSCGFGDPADDADGPGGPEGIAGVVIGGFASTNLHGYRYLASPAVDTTGATTLHLEFDRWLNSDYAPYMQNIVEVFDGSAYVVLWLSGGFPGIEEDAWSHHTFDISAYSNASLHVRFGHAVFSAGAFTTCGSWNLDNVTIATDDQPPPPVVFSRGDGNGDGNIDIADPVHHLAYLFSAGPSTCLDAQDANDDGAADIADAIYSLAYQFSGGPSYPDPTVSCGPDPTGDPLDCSSFAGCP